MTTINILIITEDPRLIEKLEEALSHEDIPFFLQKYKSDEDFKHIKGLGESISVIIDEEYPFTDVLKKFLVDTKASPLFLVGDNQFEQAAEFLSLYEGNILPKSPEYKYVDYIPVILRNLLRIKDKEATVSDALHSAEDRYQKLLHSIPGIVYKLNPDGNFTYISCGIEQLGFKSDDLIGRHFSEILAKEEIDRVSRRKVLENLHGTITGIAESPKLFDERRSLERGTHNLEVKLRQAPRNEMEKEHYGSVNAYGEISSVGQYAPEKGKLVFIGTVGIIHDITLRKRAENILHHLSVAMDLIQSGVCIFDKNNRIQYSNPFFNRMHNIPIEDTETPTIESLWKNINAPVSLEEAKKTASAQGEWSSKIQMKTQNEFSEDRHFIKMYTIANASNEITYILFHDVT